MSDVRNLLDDLTEFVDVVIRIEKLKSKIGRLPKSDLRAGLESLLNVTEGKVARECEIAYLIKQHELSRTWTPSTSNTAEINAALDEADSSSKTTPSKP